MSIRYGYIYKITNLLNGKVYVGQKKGSKLINYYWGSGIRIKEALQKYGKHNFSRDVLEWCSSPEELNEKEIYWIAKLETTNPEIGYNLSPGGGQINWKHGPEHHSYGKKASPETIQKLKDSHKGQVSPMKGKHLTEQQKQKLREANIGKLQSEETRKKRSESLKGHITTEETRHKISEALKGRVVPEKTIQNIKIAMKSITYTLVCRDCGKIFVSKAPSRKYCDNCKQNKFRVR